MRIGIIGAGYAATAHSKAIEKIDPNISRYVYDVKAKTACKFADENGCRAVKNLGELYDSVDAIIVATPTSTHFKLTIEAMRKDKHILCEKPMAMLVSEAIDMLDICREKKLICAVGFNYRFFDIIKILQENEDIGALIHIDILIERLFRTDWHNDGVGALFDLGIHIIDLIAYLCHESIALDSCSVCISDDNATVICGKTEGGVSFHLTAARITEPRKVRFCMNIVGAKGGFDYDSRLETIYTVEKDNIAQVFQFKKAMDTAGFFDFTDSVFRQDKAWIQAMLGDPINKLASFEDGLRSQIALDYFLTKSFMVMR